MTVVARRLLAFAGSLVLGLVVGGGFDAASVTANHDSDMTTRGLVAGAALGLVAASVVRD